MNALLDLGDRTLEAARAAVGLAHGWWRRCPAASIPL
jgi:hypothetical protein